MAYNLGNFADQLSLGQVNGALGNVGSDYRVGAPAQPSPWKTAMDMAPALGQQQPEQSDEEKQAQKRQALLKTAGSLIGAYFTGGASLAGSAGGGAAGGILGGLLGGGK